MKIYVVYGLVKNETATRGRLFEIYKAFHYEDDAYIYIDKMSISQIELSTKCGRSGNFSTSSIEFEIEEIELD